MVGKFTSRGDESLKVRGKPGSSTELGRRRPPEHHDSASDILHLAELVGPVRRRFAIASSFPDDAILASLKAIAGRSETNARIATAFMSNLGQHLELGGQDHRSAIITLVGLLPPPRS